MQQRQKPLISVLSIKGQTPDRLAYIKDRAAALEDIIEQSLKEFSDSLWITLSLDKFKFSKLKKIFAPVILSSVAYAIGEIATSNLSKALTDTEDYDYIFKLIIANAILGYSSNHIITEQEKDAPNFTFAAAGEMLGVTYLYQASFQGSNRILKNFTGSRYNFLLSLITSTLAIPGGLAYLIQLKEKFYLKKQHMHGAQRSDTALISSGITAVANTFFQMNRLIIDEVLTIPRLFQIGLISNNILHDKGLGRQLRNLPSMIIDMVPQMLRKLDTQWNKLEEDYAKNMTTHSVVEFSNNTPTLFKKKRHQLRQNDLVRCADDNFDANNVPISGEIVFLNQKNEYQEAKFSVNLKPHTGEDVFIELTTKPTQENVFNAVDQHAIQAGKQAAILNGSKIDFYGNQDQFFIRVAKKKELGLSGSYEKKAIINTIINDYKRKNIYLAVGLALITGGYLGTNAVSMSKISIRLLFSLFQMMIPFSEAFLREMVNSRLIRDLNNNLQQMPLEAIDGLRAVDFINSVSGYYSSITPKGAAIISDKTGTLTTSKMNMLGLWQENINPAIRLSLIQKKPFEVFKTFYMAFTNSRKEMEPEEHAILDFFDSEKDGSSIEAITPTHLRKIIATIKVDTFHLGLHRSFGGRLTIAKNHSEIPTYHLIFCGIPNAKTFKERPLYISYNKMVTRTGVLSRDWCIAKTEISENLFKEIHAAYLKEDKEAISKIIIDQENVLNSLTHQATFLIDNPVKPGVSQFIPNCSKAGIPVFVATGDTSKAAENIARLLCSDRSKKIITIRASQCLEPNFSLNEMNDTTLIFVGLDSETTQMLNTFDALMTFPEKDRPAIIFAEMSTEGKAILARHLKTRGYFVVANGDGSNDKGMMEVAHYVITHAAEDGSFAPGISQYSNISDLQIQSMLRSSQSVYELIDLHNGADSRFIKPFIRLSNAQEMISYALIFKAVKMSFEMAQECGYTDVQEVWQQHSFSIAFDLIWLWISFKIINAHTDMPVEGIPLNESNTPFMATLATLAIATLESIFTYTIMGQATDVKLMIMMLAFLPTLLTSLFTGFKKQQEAATIELLDDEVRPILSSTFITTRTIQKTEVTEMRSLGLH